MQYTIDITIKVTQGTYSGGATLDTISKTVHAESFEKMSKLVGELVRHIPKGGQ